MFVNNFIAFVLIIFLTFYTLKCFAYFVYHSSSLEQVIFYMPYKRLLLILIKTYIQHGYKYSLINSSLTADGVKIPKSVNNKVRYAGGV